MPARASARVPGLRHIAPSVACVSTLSGLKTALPSSLIQISSRMSVSTGALRPPATIASANARQRSERVRSGSPSEKRVPSPWRTTPGASSSVEQ